MPLLEYPHKPANSCASVRSSPVVSSSFQRTTRYLLQKRRSSSEVALFSVFKKAKSGSGKAGVALGDGGSDDGDEQEVVRLLEEVPLDNRL
jgi:hypothetical protein